MNEKIVIPEFLKNFAKKKNAPLFVVGLVGIMLIFFSELPFGLSNNKQVKNEAAKTTESYVEQTELKLKKMIEQVDGAGNTVVMLTLEAGIENIYAKAEKQDSDLLEENAEKGRLSSRNSYESDYVIVEDETGTPSPVVEKQLQPVIKGVAVICNGANEAAVVTKITELVSVVLGVPYNRVCVVKMQN